MRHFEYQIVRGDEDNVAATQREVNRWAAEGFRVIECAAAGTHYSKYWIWTLEREVLPAHPYK